jgi:hypothetical protein
MPTLAAVQALTMLSVDVLASLDKGDLALET